ncbi:30S ribosomal protein S1 [Clostridium sp. MSJ-11]|uniref:30S ribosomal protein S1 n=1 Tax=Clostridium mobile TaxID=2841512 RepID=A0ABS6ECY2_9CLOT|nr:30S ribosomal protein S1 [Clostridium mobile]MBU5482893.1 30S ribosomal protein S1 [Clostridium mobile]
MEEQKDVSMEEFMDSIDKSMKKIRKGDLVKGTIISLNDDEVLVNIGYMSDGIIPKEELSFEGEINPKEVLKVGEEILVYILEINDGEGNVLLSKKRADVVSNWNELEKSYNNKDVVTVKVKESVKGGALTYIKGIRAFIPISQLSIEFIKDTSTFIGEELKVRIIEFDREKERVVLSAKEIQMEEREKNKQKLWNTLKDGERRKGKVTKLMRYGAFVDLGGVEGLIHLNDLSWKRVNKPEEVVSVGDEVEVFIISSDKSKNRISLALKDVKDNPWENIDFNIGDVLEGKVVRILDFGAIVELTSGIEGLVHVSEISDERIFKPEEVLKIGDKAKVKVLDIDKEAQKMSLSIKSASNPYEEELKQYNDTEEGFTIGEMFKDLFK